MQNLKRNINMGFRVNREEQELIYRAMARTGISNLRAYMLKMAVDGRVINLELDTVAECSRLLRNVSNNINQIAKRVNETGRAYAADLKEIKERLDEVWKQQEVIVKTLSKLVEVA